MIGLEQERGRTCSALITASPSYCLTYIARTESSKGTMQTMSHMLQSFTIIIGVRKLARRTSEGSEIRHFTLGVLSMIAIIPEH